MNVADRPGVAQRLHAAIVAAIDAPVGATRENGLPMPKGAPLLPVRVLLERAREHGNPAFFRDKLEKEPVRGGPSDLS